jgi:alpha-galactosidase
MSPITGWQEFMPEFMKQEIALYKSVRGLIRDGKVYHLTPPPDGTFNDAIQAHHQESDRSVVFVYRQENPGEIETIRPRGLQAGRNYRVRFQDDPRTYVATGRELAEDGIAVALPEEFYAEVVFIDPVSP